MKRLQANPHGLTATHANLMGSPLCPVNIYKCISNGVSDINFVFKRWPGVGNGCRILPTVEEGCMFMRLKPCAHKLCKWHMLVLRQFLTRNRQSSCSGCGLTVHDSIGATPTRQPCLKVYGLARLAGLRLLHYIYCNHSSTTCRIAKKSILRWCDGSELLLPGRVPNL